MNKIKNLFLLAEQSKQLSNEANILLIESCNEIEFLYNEKNSLQEGIKTDIEKFIFFRKKNEEKVRKIEAFLEKSEGYLASIQSQFGELKSIQEFLNSAKEEIDKVGNDFESLALGDSKLRTIFSKPSLIAPFARRDRYNVVRESTLLIQATKVLNRVAWVLEGISSSVNSLVKAFTRYFTKNKDKQKLKIIDLMTKEGDKFKFTERRIKRFFKEQFSKVQSRQKQNVGILSKVNNWALKLVPGFSKEFNLPEEMNFNDNKIIELVDEILQLTFEDLQNLKKGLFKYPQQVQQQAQELTTATGETAKTGNEEVDEVDAIAKAIASAEKGEEDKSDENAGKEGKEGETTPSSGEDIESQKKQIKDLIDSLSDPSREKMINYLKGRKISDVLQGEKITFAAGEPQEISSKITQKIKDFANKNPEEKIYERKIKNDEKILLERWKKLAGLL